MRLHRHIIRADAMLDRIEWYADYLTGPNVETNDEFVREFREHVETIRSDLRHVDRKLAAFQQITDDVLHAE